MPKQKLEGYVGHGFDTRYDEGECYIYVFNRATGVKRQITLYLPQSLRNYAEIGERPHNLVTLIERGLIVRDFEPDTLRDAIVFATRTQPSVNWLAGFEGTTDEEPPDTNPRLTKLFEVELDEL